MNIEIIVTHLPSWQGRDGQRASGPDEDVVTLAVEVGRALIDACSGAVEHVILLAQRPDVLDGATAPVVMTSLRLPPTVGFEQRLGGAPATVEALLAARRGTLVIAVDDGDPGCAAAALVGADAEVERPDRIFRSLPAVVQRRGSQVSTDFGDPRLLRERGSRVAVRSLLDGERPPVVVGARGRRSEEGEIAVEVPTTGAAAPLFALVSLAELGTPARLIAVENAHGMAVDVEDLRSTKVLKSGRIRPSGSFPPPPASPATIPISLAAYDRAFEAKVGFRAQVCSCGQIAYPPRQLCPGCGEPLPEVLQPLPLDGEVYSLTTVHAQVPGMRTPYTVGVVSLDGVAVRVLAHVTDVPAGEVRIGDRGRLVLRKVAERMGVPDYGYGFSPVEVAQ